MSTALMRMCVCVCYNRTGRTPPRDTHYGTSAILVYENDGAGSNVWVGFNLDQHIDRLLSYITPYLLRVARTYVSPSRMRTESLWHPCYSLRC